MRVRSVLPGSTATGSERAEMQLALTHAPPPSTPPELTSAVHGCAARQLVFHKAERWQLLGVRFFSAFEASRRGFLDVSQPVVSLVSVEGPLHGVLHRGDRVLSVGGERVRSPEAATSSLRAALGDVQLAVLPPSAAVDLSIDGSERLPKLPPASPIGTDGRPSAPMPPSPATQHEHEVQTPPDENVDERVASPRRSPRTVARKVANGVVHVVSTPVRAARMYTEAVHTVLVMGT
jgi:hypothetical protein